MIELITLASGGFKIITTGTHRVERFYSNLQYVVENDQIILAGLIGSKNDFVINGAFSFASVDALCAAMDAAGVGGSKFIKPALPARGTIKIDSDPDDQDTVTINDGTNEVVFEFTGGKAAGTVTFVNEATPTNPADGDLLTFDNTGPDETVFEFNGGSKFKVGLEFGDGEETQNPVDGNTVTLGDDVFIFLDEAEGLTAFTEVEIGETAAATMAAFITAFNLAITGHTATAADTPDNTCTIEADTVGEDGNVIVEVKSNYIQLEEIASGLDNGDNISDPDYIGVPIGATATATMTSFIAAFAANVGNYTITGSTPADNACAIKALEIGEDYNAAFATDSDNITAVDLTGGIDAETNLTEGNIGVDVGETTAVTAQNLAQMIYDQAADGNILIFADDKENTVYLSATFTGVTGNEDITKSCDAITVTGLSGGRAAVGITEIITALEALAI